MMKNFTVSTFPTSAIMAFFLFNLLTMDVNAKSISVGQRRNYSPKSNFTKQDNFRITEGSSSKIIVEARDDVELNCNIAHLSSSIQYEWYKQNPNGVGRKRMTQFRGRYELSSQGQVKIRSLTHEDSGTYICKTSSSNSETYSIHLTVSGEDSFKNNLLKPTGARRGSSAEEEPYSEPQIIRDQLPKLKIFPVAKGLPILLKCESKGNPSPTITWYKNSEILSSSKGNISALKLFNVSQSDNAIYKCESVNLFGISIYEITLQVTDVWHGAAEIIEMSPRNLTILAGSSVNISCVAKFETDPWFSWVKKVKSNKTDKVFFHTNTSAYYEVLQNSVVKGRGEGIYSTDLILTNVTKNDSGDYFCAVAGLQGFNISETTLIVESDPSQLEYSNPKTVAAQWAILWTSSFIILVILIVLCFVRIYGCHNHSHPHPPKSVEKPVAFRKTQLPESSPLTMSTHCTTHMQCPEAFVPLMGMGSCSLSSSQDQCLGYESSNNTSPNRYLHLHHHFPSSIASSSNSTLLANLEAARSYCPNSRCSDYYFEPPNCTSSNEIRRVHKTRRNRRVRHQRSNINNAPPQNNFNYSSYGDSSHSQCSAELHNPNNLFSTDGQSNYYEPKRKKLSLQRQGDYYPSCRIDSHS